MFHHGNNFFLFKDIPEILLGDHRHHALSPRLLHLHHGCPTNLNQFKVYFGEISVFYLLRLTMMSTVGGCSYCFTKILNHIYQTVM